MSMLRLCEMPVPSKERKKQREEEERMQRKSKRSAGSSQEGRTFAETFKELLALKY